MGKQSAKTGLVELGIGVVSLIAVDAILNQVKKLQKEGKLNKKEGEKMMKDVSKKFNDASSKYGKELQSQVDNVIRESAKASPFATKKDIEDLNSKITKLIAASKKRSRK